MHAQVVHRPNVIEKRPPDVSLRRCGADVHIFLRLAIRRPCPDHVTLVGDDVVKFVSAKKPASRIISPFPLRVSIDTAK